MGYDYRTERPFIFTEDGVPMLGLIQSNARRLLASSGAFRLDKAIANVSGESWHMLACIDYMVERGMIIEVTEEARVAGQNRVFVGGNICSTS